jgi:cystathionine beta-lyase/cystathionine gamma-synthase
VSGPRHASGPSTTAVHAADAGRRGVVGPIERSATFRLDAAGLADVEATGGADTWYYSRLANPTVAGAARVVAALERAEAALLFASGMAAIATALSAIVRPGGRLVAAAELYGDTIALLGGEWAAAGRTVTYVDVADHAAVSRALAPGADALLVEAISNPMLRVADLSALAGLAHAAGALAVVDATFASPFNVRPVDHGFDLVLHSATKYLNGHADLIAGAAVGGAAIIERLRPLAVLRGATLDPSAAFLLERGLKTLALRVQRQNENGLAVAGWLNGHREVAAVSYPGLPGHPDHALAGRLLRGGGGLVTVTVTGDDRRGRRLLDSLGLIAHAASLGGVESLACAPRLTSHAALHPDELDRLGIMPNTVRLSLGIEDAEDLIADLEQALTASREGA